MKFIDEYRDPDLARKYVREIERVAKGSWNIMEVCGGQTHAIVRYGIDSALPRGVSLLHGPGCPVCVTPVETIDKALELASRDNVTFCSFGDMLRVPGSTKDLLSVRAEGGDVRIVYSPLDSLKIARENPDREVVFFGIGFETTAPTTAMTLLQAKRFGLSNFSVLTALVLIPPAIESILDSPLTRVNAFLAPGHVCTVTGYREYERLSEKYGVPIVVTGFEAVDLLQGILMSLRQLENSEARAENQYGRAVQIDGNTAARKLMDDVFEVIDRKWRGFGTIPSSGYGLSDDYSEFDAEKRFGLSNRVADESTECISAQILQGIKKPSDCPAFGITCTPEKPLGATMVSNEGACNAYYRYRSRAKSKSTLGKGGEK